MPRSLINQKSTSRVGSVAGSWLKVERKDFFDWMFARMAADSRKMKIFYFALLLCFWVSVIVCPRLTVFKGHGIRRNMILSTIIRIEIKNLIPGADLMVRFSRQLSVWCAATSRGVKGYAGGAKLAGV